MSGGKTILGLAVALVISVACAADLSADSIAATTAGGNAAQPSTNTVHGWRFDLSSAIRVTELGLWDSAGNGFEAAHAIGIYDSSGTLLATATVAAGTGSALDSGYRWESIAPTVLAAGNGYEIVAHFGTDDDQVLINTTVTTASMITYDVGVFGFSPTLAPSTGNDPAADDSRFGPNFKFDAVPEPSSLALVGLFAGVGLLVRRRNRK